MPRRQCDHFVRLGDGKTHVRVTEEVDLNVALYDDYGDLQSPILTTFYVIDSLGTDVIIGLPALLGDYYNFFLTVMRRGARSKEPNDFGCL